MKSLQVKLEHAKEIKAECDNKVGEGHETLLNIDWFASQGLS